ncbi:DUF3866 family protein [Spiractinospora alimapuensis]|uniref:DUF3866 family protein n=1 Tax=Spiractinospora alimapuensis TaxID=2820884 RepID=UPI001F1B9A51|nr:DUF3866 family protein [Spiractinospora alimapuensis]QVQ52520.1 DUF3866 family protein [Spiractinospora alimapuensis]
MIDWRAGIVVGPGRTWHGAIELEVLLESDGGSPETDGSRCAALAYPRLVGRPRPGDRVLLNTNAVRRGLGTGGYALVVALPGGPPRDLEGPGHLVKARYTPLQACVLGVEEPDSPHYATLCDADDLEGTPVVVADLHSALPAIVAGAREGRDGPWVVYVMLDGGALPVWFSRIVATLRAEGLLAATVTTGQAFGGELEATTVHMGLLAARHVLHADVIVAIQGPGNLGTSTRWGFSGVAAGEVVNAAACLGGRPVATLRISSADPRARHQAVSHHSLTAYGRVALAQADVVVPDLSGTPGVAAEFARQVRAQAEVLAPRHRLVEVSTSGLDTALASLPVELSTMGRDLDTERAYFLAAAAAGRHAASLVGAS